MHVVAETDQPALATTERPRVVLPAPTEERGWRYLVKGAGARELQAHGMRRWRHTQTGTVWLFPVEWYEAIPEGLRVITIEGHFTRFNTKLMPLIEHAGGLLGFGLHRWEKQKP